MPVHCLLARLEEAEAREGRRRREGRTHAVTHDRLACVVLLGEHLNVEDLLEQKDAAKVSFCKIDSALSTFSSRERERGAQE